MTEIVLVQKEETARAQLKTRLPMIFWIVILSFAIRIFFLFLFSPPAPNPEADDGLYYTTALQLKEYFEHGGDLIKEVLSGNGFRGTGLLQKYGLEIPWGALRRGPIYCGLAAFIFWITGSVNPFVIYLAQALLTSVAGFFLFGIGKQLNSPQAGLLAAAFNAVYPPLIFMSNQFMQESATIFFFSLFYFLFLNTKIRQSLWGTAALGLLLGILSLTKSSLAFFPFFLFTFLVFGSLVKKLKMFEHKNLFTFILLFFVPYLLWMGIVSWQFHKPTTVVVTDHPGRVLFLNVLPDFDAWTPDSFHMPLVDAKTADIFKREGIATSKNFWPEDSILKHKAIQIFFKDFPANFTTIFKKLRRLWWNPFGWAWFKIPVSSMAYCWTHRLMVMSALLGGVFLLGQRKEIFFFIIGPLYGILLCCFNHVEIRYVLIYTPVVFFFSGYFFYFLYMKRELIFSSFFKIWMTIACLTAIGGAYYLSQFPYLALVFPRLEDKQVAAFFLASKNLAVIGFFAGVYFLLKPVISTRNLLLRFWFLAALLLIPFNVFALTELDWWQWRTPINGSNQIIRQEIFIPSKALNDVYDQNLRIDLQVFAEPISIAVFLNGQKIGDYEAVKINKPVFFIPAYLEWFPRTGQEIFAMRQWYTVSIPKGLLKENSYNVIDVRGNSALSKKKDFVVFGDYLISSNLPYVRGPLFQHYPSETSFFKLMDHGDFRLNGITPLHSLTTKSSFFDGQFWKNKDLSPDFGIQRGLYRIRVEVKNSKGEFLIY